MATEEVVPRSAVAMVPMIRVYPVPQSCSEIQTLVMGLSLVNNSRQNKPWVQKYSPATSGSVGWALGFKWQSPVAGIQSFWIKNSADKTEESDNTWSVLIRVTIPSQNCPEDVTNLTTVISAGCYNTEKLMHVIQHFHITWILIQVLSLKRWWIFSQRCS